MIKWEYTTVTAGEAGITQQLDLLNEAGEDGWELSGYSENLGFGTVFLMKRPKLETIVLDLTKTEVKERVEPTSKQLLSIEFEPDQVCDCARPSLEKNPGYISQWVRCLKCTGWKWVS